MARVDQLNMTNHCPSNWIISVSIMQIFVCGSYSNIFRFCSECNWPSFTIPGVLVHIFPCSCPCQRVRLRTSLHISPSPEISYIFIPFLQDVPIFKFYQNYYFIELFLYVCNLCQYAVCYISSFKAEQLLFCVQNRCSINTYWIYKLPFYDILPTMDIQLCVLIQCFDDFLIQQHCQTVLLVFPL